MNVQSRMKIKWSFHFARYILQPRVVSVCRVPSQAAESLIWVKEDKITFVENRFWNLILLEGMWPTELSQESATPSLPLVPQELIVSVVVPQGNDSPNPLLPSEPQTHFGRLAWKMNMDYWPLIAVESSEGNDWLSAALAAGERLQVTF